MLGKSIAAVAFVTAAALMLVSAATADPPGWVMLPPQAAAQAASAPGYSFPGTVRRATVAEAARAAHQPGADTEGALPTGRTIQSVRRHAEEEAACFFASPSDSWGYWPYNQSVTQNTYWCRGSGVITYRSTYITMDSNICSPHDPYTFKTDGGAGTSQVIVMGGAYFACSTLVPWAPINTNDYAGWAYHAIGLYWEVYRN